MNDEIKEILYVLKHIVIGRATRLTCREADKLLDYITNLQQENESLRTRIKTIKRLRKKQTQKKNKYKSIIFDEEQKLIDYKSRVEKAVEYINCNKQKTICAYGDNEDDDFEICLFEEDIDELLNILQNGSDSQ